MFHEPCPIERETPRTSDLVFERPSLSHRRTFARWLAEWKADAYDPYPWIFVRAWSDFDWYVNLCDRMESEGSPPELPVPLEARWALRGGEMVGELYLFFQPMDGDNHIGYKVRPSFRRLGIGTALLRYGLDRLRARGIEDARLTCADTNVASAALLERAGGVRLEDKRGRAGRVLRRYSLTTHVL